MLRSVEEHYGIEVRVVGPVSPVTADVAPGECCNDKVTLLEMALQDCDAWVSGIRRSQTSQRRTAEVLGRDNAGRTKINPLAQWSDEDAARFARSRNILRNPLLDQGYLSIGCEPCTTPPEDASDARSGRWAGSTRTECGLHLT
jgi:phosphoadenosine phosphosulfate reductase